MVNNRQIKEQLNAAKHGVMTAKRHLGRFGKTAAAAIAGAALLLGNVGRTITSNATAFKEQAFQPTKKSGEVFEVKKSTLVALLVALAAVAGVLGALYVYVLRREKELDEYEQLLFSEDFSDDLLDDQDDLADVAE